MIEGRAGRFSWSERNEYPKLITDTKNTITLRIHRYRLQETLDRINSKTKTKLPILEASCRGSGRLKRNNDMSSLVGRKNNCHSVTIYMKYSEINTSSITPSPSSDPPIPISSSLSSWNSTRSISSLTPLSKRESFFLGNFPWAPRPWRPSPSTNRAARRTGTLCGS